MATTAIRGTPVHTVGELPAVGAAAPDFTLTGPDLADVPRPEGTRVVLNIFPSVDTGVCALSVRTFNKLAADLDNTTVICASKDLPFALKRFCGAEGIDNVTAASAEYLDAMGFGFTVALAPSSTADGSASPGSASAHASGR